MQCFYNVVKDQSVGWQSSWAGTCANEGRLAKVTGQLAELGEVGCSKSPKLQALRLWLGACTLAGTLPKGCAGRIVEGVDGFRQVLLHVVGYRGLPGVVSPRLP